MKLENAYLRVSVETGNQFEEAVKTPGVELIYLDAGFFAKEDLRGLVRACHKGSGGIGKLCGLRLPRIWRTEAEEFFQNRKEEIRAAGFDCFLSPNIEGALFLREAELSEDGSNVVLDHSIYRMNSATENALERILGMDRYSETFSLEMSSRELLQDKTSRKREFCVYGRVPMMVTAQCIRKTSLRCDRRMCTMILRDRTGAMLPVKNCCTFCYNTIYNSVPSVITDLAEEIRDIGPDSVRYEFTTENAEEMKKVLRGEMPKNYTRGHFHKEVL